MILHIPHSQRHISPAYRNLFVLDDADLHREQRRLVDAYTDELFQFEDAMHITFKHSRLLVDVERFPDDANEPMSSVGMGAIYTQTSNGQALKRTLTETEREGLMSLYENHHKALTAVVDNELQSQGVALIVDCHSFPSEPLPCDMSQKKPRPDFCIGVDELHTPTKLVKELIKQIRSWGYAAAINDPYAGTLVPSDYYQINIKVKSVMIEVNRSLYMNEITGEKLTEFNDIKLRIHKLLSLIQTYSRCKGIMTP